MCVSCAPTAVNNQEHNTDDNDENDDEVGDNQHGHGGGDG